MLEFINQSIEQDVKALIGGGLVKKNSGNKKEVRNIRTGALLTQDECFKFFLLPLVNNEEQYLSRDFMRQGTKMTMDFMYIVNSNGERKEFPLNSITNPIPEFVDGVLESMATAKRYTGTFVNDWRNAPTWGAGLSIIRKKQENQHVKVTEVIPVHTAFIPRSGEDKGVPQESDRAIYRLDWEDDDPMDQTVDAPVTEAPATEPATEE